MSESKQVDRRSFLGASAAALTMGGAAMAADANKTSLAAPARGAPTVPHAEPGPNGMPYGMLGKARLSRLFLGGNLIAGFMHSRDLLYVNELFRAYATEKKIFETLKVAEEHGINTLFESGGEFVARYNKQFGGHMLNIPSIHPDINQSDASIKDEIKQKIDSGAPAMYVWGVRSDGLVQSGAVDVIKKAVEFAKKYDIPVGVGGHLLQVPKACEKAKVPCDFYVKTFHNNNYPSFNLGCDSRWCDNAEETAAFMATIKKPWIAFKVLAAGAILPRQGFAYAFRNGADFIAVGMFDFQIKEDCELVKSVVAKTKKRQRPWYA